MEGERRGRRTGVPSRLTPPSHPGGRTAAAAPAETGQGTAPSPWPRPTRPPLTQASAWARAVGGAATVLLGLVACGRPGGSPPVGWPRVLPPFAQWTVVDLAPAWSQPLPGPSSLAVAADGSVVVGATPAGPWAVDASGRPRDLGQARGSAVFPLPAGFVGVGPGVSDAPGTFSLLSSDGTVVWTQRAVGPMVVAGSADGSRVLVVDEGDGAGTLLGVSRSGASPLPAPGLAALGPGVVAQFDLQDDALVSDLQRVQLLGPSGGAARWSVSTGPAAPSRQLALSPSGAAVAAATGQGDDTLYQFRVQGNAPELMWTQTLPPGGANLLAVAPDGRLAVWDVGGGPTVAVYRPSDGAMLWQDTFASSGGAVPTLEAVAFGPNDGVVAVLDACSGGAPCLAFLGADGAPLGYVELPAGDRLVLAADGLVAAGEAPASGVSAARVLWWDLGGIWHALLGSAAS